MTSKLTNLRPALNYYLNERGIEVLDFNIISNELHITLLQKKKALFLTFIISDQNKNKNFKVKYFDINEYQFQIDLIEDIAKYLNQTQWYKITEEFINNLREVNVLINSSKKIYLDNIYKFFNLKTEINFYVYDTINNKELYINKHLNNSLRMQYQLALIKPDKNNCLTINPVVEKLINYYIAHITAYLYKKKNRQIKIFQF